MLGNVTLQARVKIENVAWINKIINALRHDEMGQDVNRVMQVGELVDPAITMFRNSMQGKALDGLAEARLKTINELKQQGEYHGQRTDSSA